MKIALINGSPKANNSASEELLNELTYYIDINNQTEYFLLNRPHISDEDITRLNSCDVWVFAFPLYVDAVPSQLVSCLCEIEKKTDKNKTIKVFAIVNCGFYEGIQNETAIQIIKNFCSKAGLEWGMGIGFGGGGALSFVKSVPNGKGPKKQLGEALKNMADNIENNSESENIYISIGLSYLAYKFGAEFGWRKLIKLNGKKPRDIYTKL